MSATSLVASNLVCPCCGEPATGPLSFFSSMPMRYRRPHGDAVSPVRLRPPPAAPREPRALLR